VWIKGVAPPHPDQSDSMAKLLGTLKRVAVDPPAPDLALMREFKEFVLEWLKKNMTPLAYDVDTSKEAWLKKTPYPAYRKKDLINKWQKINNQLTMSKEDSKYFLVDAFTKDETYGLFKHNRGINARKDEFKVAVGPIFKLIEEQLFLLPNYIKKVPVIDRPKYIYDMLYRENSEYDFSDYESFEAHYTKLVFEACEFQLYDFMTQFLPEHKEFMTFINDVIGGINTVDYKSFIYFIVATRMTGEMCTSCGNGFTNSMLFEFACFKTKCVDIAYVDEGDDGIFTYRMTTEERPTPEFYLRLGFTIKLDRSYDISTASFCGLIFAPEDLINITDPIETLVCFGWTKRKYSLSNDKTLNKLLYAKALSMKYQYCGCPILENFSSYVLRVLGKRYFKPEEYDSYKIEFANEMLEYVEKNGIPYKTPGLATRRLMEDQFSVTREDQLIIESYFDKKTDLSEIFIPQLDKYLQNDWIIYYNHYFREVSESNINEPVLHLNNKVMFSKEMLNKIQLDRELVIPSNTGYYG